MSSVVVQKNVAEVAAYAAEQACSVLAAAIAEHGEAVWLLAGGTAPLAAYALIAEQYRSRLDWQKVWFAIGDERCVVAASPDYNWGQIARALLNPLNIPVEHRLVPLADATAEPAASAYAAALTKLPQIHNMPRFDLAWFGMGEDGHTLSLFPGQPEVADRDELVTAVHDSPKPPPDRITLTLRALAGVQNGYIVTTGDAKADAIRQVLHDRALLPVLKVAQAIENGGGTLAWLLDEAAAAALN